MHREKAHFITCFPLFLAFQLFGEAILGLSQGSVSELLCKPKPCKPEPCKPEPCESKLCESKPSESKPGEPEPCESGPDHCLDTSSHRVRQLLHAHLISFVTLCERVLCPSSLALLAFSAVDGKALSREHLVYQRLVWH